MSKRHNRKRTRSRPRHRDAQHTRTPSIDTEASFSSNPSVSQPSYFSIANQRANHWHQTYLAWQNRQREQQQHVQALEAQLRMFGGEAGDDMSLIEPMLNVVTSLFDGSTDYTDP
jgi:hypothetical protein